MGCGCQSKKIKTYLRASNRKSSDFANRKPSRSRGQTNQGIDQGDNGARGAASNQLTRFAHAVLMAFVRLGQIADIFRPSGPADLAMPENRLRNPVNSCWISTARRLAPYPSRTCNSPQPLRAE